MSWVQLRLFDVPEPGDGAETLHVRVEAELPGPGYDHLVVELVNDTLSRLCHDQGLFPSRVTVEVDLDYVDDCFFDDSSTTGADNMTIDPVSAPTGGPQIE